MTTIYTFDGAGYYAGPHTITNPLAPQPAGTPIAPPDAPDGHVPMWTGTAWVVVPVPVPAAPTAEQLREQAKAARQIAVDNIKVTTAAGNTFDGDETSQTRMSRAILVLSTGASASVPWVLADNTVIQATAAELAEALALAGAEQARLWVLPSGII